MISEKTRLGRLGAMILFFLFAVAGPAAGNAHVAETWYRYTIAKQAAGYLHVIVKSRAGSGDLRFEHRLVLGEADLGTGEAKDVREFTVHTLCRKESFQPVEMSVKAVDHLPEIRDGKLVTRNVFSHTVTFQEQAANSIAEGIFRVTPEKNGQTMPVPEQTITDLVFFEAVKKLPFSKGITLSYHTVETLELNLKKKHRLQYMGRDPEQGNLHRFSEVNHGQESYWLDGSHTLKRVAWDKDKVFMLTTEGEATTVFQ